MEPNKLIKDKNKLLMAIPVILGILFLYVFFIRENGNGMSGSDKQAASQAFLEPQSEMADKVNDKMEAYKHRRSTRAGRILPRKSGSSCISTRR